MKKQQQIVFVAASAAILMAATGAWADTAKVNGITWTYTVSNGKAILKFYETYSGSTIIYNPCIPKTTSGAISVPSTLGGYPVEIGNGAFTRCDKITSVTIPNGVTGFGGSSVFSNCSSLQSVIIGNGVTNIASAFVDCSALSSVTIGNGVTSIGQSAFSGCSALTSVTIPDSITSIESYAFNNCSALTSVTIPDSVTRIHQDAFKNCSSLNANWYKALNNLAMEGDEEPPDPRYTLGTGVSDRTIATVTVTGDSAIDSFVLSDGKVFDTVLRIINVSSTPSTLTLPSGYAYEQLKGTEPLTIPALSTNLLTITRTADSVFFVAREELEPAQ